MQLQFNGTAYIVNQDPGGRYSQQLIDQLGMYKGLTVKTISAEDADARLERSNIQMAVFIPADFSKNLEAGQPTQILFKQRGNGGTEGQIAASLVRWRRRESQPGGFPAKPGQNGPERQRRLIPTD